MAQTAQINIKIDGKQAQEQFTNLRKGISETNSELTKIISKYGENSKQADAQRKVLASLNIEYDKMSKSVTDLNARFDDLYTDTLPMTTRLGEIEDRLYELALAGDNASREFRDLMGEAGRLRQTIIQTDMSVDAMALTMGQKLMGATQGIVGAFAIAQGGMALFGSESEEVQQALLKVQSIMALLQGIDAFKQSLPSVKALGSSIMTSLVPSLGGATAATSALSLAMKTIPILALIGGITLLIANWEKVSKALFGVNQQQKILNDVGKKVNETIASEVSAADRLKRQLNDNTLSRQQQIKAVKDFQSKYPNLLSNINAETASTDEVNKALALNIQLRKLQAQSDALSEKRGEFYKEQLDAELEYQDKVRGGYQLGARLLGVTENVDKARLKRLNESKKEAQDNIDFLDKEDDKINEQIETLINKGAVGEKEADAEKKRRDDADKAAEEAKRKAEQAAEEAKRRAEEAERKRQEGRQKDLEDFKIRLDREEKYTDELEKLNSDREEIGEGVFVKRTESEKRYFEKSKELEDMREDMIKTATDRQLRELDDSYVKGTMSLEEFNNKRTIILENGGNNLLQIEKDYLDKRQELIDLELEQDNEKYKKKQEIAVLSTEKLLNEISQMERDMAKENEIRDIQNSTMSEEKKQEEILKIKKEYLDGDIALLEMSSQSQINILEKQRDEELSNLELSSEERRNIETKYNKEILGINQSTQKKIQGLQDETTKNQKTNFENTIEDIKGYVEEYGKMFMDGFSAVNGLLNQISENRINKLNEDNEVELEKLQQQLDARIINDEQYNDKKRELDFIRNQEETKLKKQQFKRDKAFNIANAVMQGAIAVLNGLSTQPLVPVGLVMAGIAGVMSGIQIATVSSQQFTAARGGIVPSNGLPGDVDSVNAKLAPGEAVINSRSTAMFPNVLSLINQAGGGEPLVPEMTQQGSSGSGTIFGENQPQMVRAYVVETEITDTQRKIGRIQRAVEF